MLIKILILFLMSTSVFSQVEDMNLGDLDDLLLLEEELGGSPPEKEDSEELAEDDDIDEEADQLLEEDNQVSQGDKGLMEDLMLIEEGEEKIEKEIKEQELEIADQKLAEKERKEIMATPPTNPEDIDFGVIEELSEARKKNITTLVQAKKRQASLKTRFKNYQVEALKVQLSDISKSPIKLIYVPRKTRMVRLKDGNVFYPTRGFYAKAHTQLDFSKQRYIVNEKDELAYSVMYNQVSNIDQMTDLYRPPHRFKRLEKRVEKRNKYDEVFDYSLNFNLHFALNYPEYTKKLIGNPSMFAPTLRIESAWVSKLDFDFQAGLTGMYENLGGQIEDGGNYSMQSLSIGPIFKTNRFWGDYRGVIQARLSVFSRISISSAAATTNYTLSENVMLLGLEKEYDKGKFGKFLFGYNFQRKWLKTAASGDIATGVNARTRYDDSFGIYIGHRSDWIW